MLQYRFDVKIGKGELHKELYLYARDKCEALCLVERGYPGWSILYLRSV